MIDWFGDTVTAYHIESKKKTICSTLRFICRYFLLVFRWKMKCVNVFLIVAALFCVNIMTCLFVTCLIWSVLCCRIGYRLALMFYHKIVYNNISKKFSHASRRVTDIYLSCTIFYPIRLRHTKHYKKSWLPIRNIWRHKTTLPNINLAIICLDILLDVMSSINFPTIL